ncbi:hypothetical protein D9M68_920810 [compost metagenome]
MPAGTTPSAIAASSLPQPQVTTRSGAASIVVVPQTCSRVTGKSWAKAGEAASGRTMASDRMSMTHLLD